MTVYQELSGRRRVKGHPGTLLLVESLRVDPEYLFILFFFEVLKLLLVFGSHPDHLFYVLLVL